MMHTTINFLWSTGILFFSLNLCACNFKLLKECRKEILNIEKIKNLLEGKANPQSDNYPLHALFSHPHDTPTLFTVLKLFIDHHADINQKNNDKFTQLHLVFGDKDFSFDRYKNTPVSYQIVKLLLTNKADSNIKNRSGKTTLHVAASNLNTSLPVVKLLVKHNADLSTKYNGKRPLTAFCETKVMNPFIIEFFLKNNAKPNAKKNSSSYSPAITLLQRKEYSSSILKTIKTLLFYKADPNPVLYDLGLSGYKFKEKNEPFWIELIPTLLEHNADPCKTCWDSIRPYNHFHQSKIIYMKLLYAIPAWIKEKKMPLIRTFLLCIKRYKKLPKPPKYLLLEMVFNYIITGYQNIIKAIKQEDLEYCPLKKNKHDITFKPEGIDKKILNFIGINTRQNFQIWE